MTATTPSTVTTDHAQATRTTISARDADRINKQYQRGHTIRLPSTTSDSWDWQLRAQCRGLSIDLFYPVHGATLLERRRIERDAKRICATCPVLDDCRRHAITAREPFGVWGGLTSTERALGEPPRAPTTHAQP